MGDSVKLYKIVIHLVVGLMFHEFFLSCNIKYQNYVWPENEIRETPFRKNIYSLRIAATR
jgi:hypothetical protein